MVDALRHCRRAVPRPGGADLATGNTARLRGEIRVMHFRSFRRGFCRFKHILNILIINLVSLKTNKRCLATLYFLKNHRLPSFPQNHGWE